MMYSPCYELMTVCKKTRKANFKRFYTIKDAIESVSPEIMFDKEHEYLLFNKLSKNNSFIRQILQLWL